MLAAADDVSSVVRLMSVELENKLTVLLIDC